MTGAIPVSNLKKSPFSLAELKDSLRSFGMIPLCIFRPGPNDGVPDIEPGLPAKTLILVGNAGPEMWAAVMVIMMPMILFAFLLQCYLIRGLTFGVIKG